MRKITSKIIGFELKKEETAIEDNTQVMNETLQRPYTMSGKTYKIKLPSEDSAMYITINNITLNEGTSKEETRPFEIFINSKNTSHRQWVDTLTRVISAVFRKGGEIDFLVEELKSITDPNGGGWYRGRYVKSLVSEIGHILEEHIASLNSVQTTQLDVAATIKDEEADEIAGATKCPSCGVKAVVKKDGCPTCLACGDSKCG
jgi:hypothetical protein